MSAPVPRATPGLLPPTQGGSAQRSPWPLRVPWARETEAGVYVAVNVARDIEPLIRPRPASKDVERDGAGQITRVVELPADPPAVITARRVGFRVARQFIEDECDDANVTNVTDGQERIATSTRLRVYPVPTRQTHSGDGQERVASLERLRVYPVPAF